MRDNALLLMDAQDEVNLSSTGVISDYYCDMEVDSAAGALLTDDQVQGYMNVVITAIDYTSGGTEGLVLEVRNGDNSNLSTSAEVIGVQDVPLAKVVAGAQFSVPFRRDVAEKYLGGWVRAKSTTYTGTVTFDAEFSDTPFSENESLQKVPA